MLTAPQDERPLLTVACIIDMTAEYFHVPREDLLSERRAPKFARPRQAAMWLARKMLPVKSLPQIARVFGRDHTTVMHAIAQIEKRRKNPFFAAHLDNLRREIQHATVSPATASELSARLAEEATEAFRAAALALAARDPAGFVRRLARLTEKEPADGP